MALPAAPATITAKPGSNPGAVIVTVAAVTATPAVTSYTCYLSDDSGVSNVHFAKKKTSTSPIFHFEDLDSRNVYAIALATNATGDGTLSAVAHAHPRH